MLCSLDNYTSLLLQYIYCFFLQICRLYPENRQLQLNASTSLLVSSSTIQPSEARHILEQQHDVELLPRDLYNLKSKIKKSSFDAAETQVILDSITQAGGSVCYGLTESGEFKYLSYMTHEMIKLITLYPGVDSGFHLQN